MIPIGIAFIILETAVQGLHLLSFGTALLDFFMCIIIHCTYVFNQLSFQNCSFFCFLGFLRDLLESLPGGVGVADHTHSIGIQTEVRGEEVEEEGERERERERGERKRLSLSARLEALSESHEAMVGRVRRGGEEVVEVMVGKWKKEHEEEVRRRTDREMEQFR